MKRARRRLSPRMLRLTRWYSTGRKPSGAPTQEEAIAKWDAFVDSRRARTLATTHGLSRRDETRP